MTLLNLAGPALIVLAASTAQPVAQAPEAKDAPPPRSETHDVIKIRTNGNTSRPPMNTDEQTRAAFEAFLQGVNKTYESLPDDENRLPDQPRTRGGEGENNKPH